MSNSERQLSLFDVSDSDRVNSERSTRAMVTELVRKRTELECGVRDYNRLKPLQSQYEALVNQYRGVVRFINSSRKFEVLEARQITRFLHSWKVIEKRLFYECSELEKQLGLKQD